MRRQLWLGLIAAGAIACVQPGGFALGQAPGSRPMSQTPSTVPGNNDPAAHQNPAEPDITPAQNRVDDKRFVKDAAMSAMTEVEIAKLATERASSDSIKQFAQATVDDQNKLTEELRKIAGNEKMDVPESIDSKHQSRVDKLSKLSGTEFDRTMIKDMTKNHQQDVREFQSEAQGGADPAVKEFASKSLPTLQQHLETAKSLSKEVSNSARNRDK
jgi:putative membrane protein